MLVAAATFLDEHVWDVHAGMQARNPFYVAVEPLAAGIVPPNVSLERRRVVVGGDGSAAAAVFRVAGWHLSYARLRIPLRLANTSFSMFSLRCPLSAC